MTIHLPENLESSILEAVHSGQLASLDDAMAKAAELLLEKLKQQRQAGGGPSTDKAAAPDDKPIWGSRGRNCGRACRRRNLQKLPKDGAEQLDHYLYGTPRRPTAWRKVFADRRILGGPYQRSGSEPRGSSGDEPGIASCTRDNSRVSRCRARKAKPGGMGVSDLTGRGEGADIPNGTAGGLPGQQKLAIWSDPAGALTPRSRATARCMANTWDSVGHRSLAVELAPDGGDIPAEQTRRGSCPSARLCSDMTACVQRLGNPL